MDSYWKVTAEIETDHRKTITMEIKAPDDTTAIAKLIALEEIKADEIKRVTTELVI